MGLLPCVMSPTAPEHPRKRSAMTNPAIANIGCKTRMDNGPWAIKYRGIFSGTSD